MIVEFKPKIDIEKTETDTVSKKDVGYETSHKICVTCSNIFWDDEDGYVKCCILNKKDNIIEPNGSCRGHSIK